MPIVTKSIFPVRPANDTAVQGPGATHTITAPPPSKGALGFGPAMTERLRIGVSACLLGREVRFDGQHKRDAFLVDALGPFVELVPVCPEVEAGMSIPREPVRLVGEAKARGCSARDSARIGPRA